MRVLFARSSSSSGEVIDQLNGALACVCVCVYVCIPHCPTKEAPASNGQGETEEASLTAVTSEVRQPPVLLSKSMVFKHRLPLYFALTATFRVRSCSTRGISSCV